MKHLWASPFLRSRYLVAMASGLLLACSFPKLGVAGFAWIAPGLMLAAALGTRGAETFRIGYVAGLTHYLTSLYWLLLIPYRWHGIPFGPALGWLALGAFLALFPATWVWLVSGDRSPHVPEPGSGLELTGPAALARRGQAGRGWLGRTLWALSGAAVWVALEMFVARVFSGFPWNLLGVSQYRMVPLIQIASLTGVYGVSFLVVWGSLSLLSAALMVIRRPTARSVWVGEVFLPVLVVAVLFNLGLREIRNEPAPARSLKLTLVQPSIPQTLIWDTSRDQQRFEELIHLSERALTNQTDVLIWPEAAVPSYARWDTNIYPAITNLVRTHHTWLILGSDDLGRPAHASRPDEFEYYNASFLVNRDGQFVSRYRKRNLVIFGEYVPLTRWLPFLQWFTPIQGGFTPGDRAVPFTLPDLGVKLSVLICFEDVFPHVARRDVTPDIDLLVNLTNDGWFDESAAQWQQACAAVFRAVENGLPLVRCSNNGLTSWVDRYGRFRQIFQDEHGSVYGPGFMTAEIPLPPPGTEHTLTFYGRNGDLFGWCCVALAAFLLGVRILPRKTAISAAALMALALVVVSCRSAGGVVSPTTALSERASYPAHWWAPVPKEGAPAWEILPQEAGPGEVILSKRNELGLLSNFAATPFTFRGKRYASLEGFWQMMKYPEGDADPRATYPGLKWAFTRDQVAQLTGFEAKHAGTLAEQNMKQMGINWVTFDGKRMEYKPAKPGDHYRLIVAATWEKVRQNPEVKKVLLQTGNLVLKPDHHQEPDAPAAWRYYEILTEIRTRLQKQL